MLAIRLVLLLVLIVGCAKSETEDDFSTSTQRLCADFIKQAMGSNEVRFTHWGDSEAGPQNRSTMPVSWEVRKNDYWEQHDTLIFLPTKPIDPSKKYTAMGDASQLWLTEADAKL